MKRKLYRTLGLRPVRADGLKAAAEVFALRKARSQFGRRGVVRALKIGAYSEDGSSGEFAAFIGYPGGLRSTIGHDIHFTVIRD